MDKPRTSTSRFCLSQDPPTQDSETYAPNDMLNEDTRHERPGHRDEFVDGPEPDPFGFVQSPRDYIAIHNRPALLSGIIARGAQYGPAKSDNCRTSLGDETNGQHERHATPTDEGALTVAASAPGTDATACVR